ncbi:hypothetical protein ACU61D_11170 [Klebsiella aerogenes]
MSKGIEQLTAMINADGVRYQQLPDSISNATFKKRGGYTEITFGTKCADVLDAVDGRKVIGIILWVPRETYDKVVKGGRS